MNFGRTLAWFGIVLAFASVLGCAHSPRGSGAGGSSPAAVDRAGSPSPAPADESLIRALLGDLESALKAKNLDAALRMYNLPDSSAATATRLRIEGAIALDSMECALHPAGIAIAGDSAEAAVLLECSYRDHGRDQGASQWWTYAFRRSANGWRIASETERDYARTRSIDLQVKLDPETGTLAETAVLAVEFLLGGETSVVLELNRGLELTGLRDASGTAPSLKRTGKQIVIALPRPAAPGDTLRCEIACSGTLFNESREQGYSQVSVAPEGCFASWVTAWYPRLDGTGSKAQGRIAFDLPEGYTVIASGRPSERKALEGRESQAFTVTTPLDYSFAAARYFHREQVIDGTNLGVYFLEGGDQKADLYLAECGRILAALRELYGAYPFDGYAVVEIPSAAAGTLGGSSEQGMNLFPVGMLPDDRIPLPLLSHEMGHSWWGNLVSGEDGPVLDEGLAQVTAVLCIQRLEGEPAMRRFLKYGWPDYPQSARLYFQRFASSTDLPLASRATAAGDRAILHDLADVKGHFVYSMLRESIGDEPFLAGLREIIRERAGRSYSLRGLQAAWEKASGRNLGSFFQQWFYRTGAPDLVLRDVQIVRTDTPTAGAHEVRGRIEQTSEPFQADVEVVAVLPDGPEVHRVPIAARGTPFAFVAGRKPVAVLLDPDYRLLRWTREFRNDSLTAVVASLRSLGRYDEVRNSLEAYLQDHPDEPDALYELGLCEQEAGRSEEAQRMYRKVVQAYELYPAYNPYVPLARLGLGKLSDLGGGRAQATVMYREVLALPDASGSHDEAAALLKSPYREGPARSFPAAEVLRSHAGTYASELLGKVEITMEPSGILTLLDMDGRRSGLVWIDGSRFRLAARDGITVEFLNPASGGEGDGQLVVNFLGREFRFYRVSG